MPIMSGRPSRGNKTKPKAKDNEPTMQEMIKTLQNTVTSLNSTVISLNNTVNTLEKSVQSQQKLITKLTARIEEQEKLINSMKAGQKKHEKLQILKFTGLTCKSLDGKAEVIQCVKEKLQIELTSADIVTRIVGRQMALTSEPARVPPGRNSAQSAVPPSSKQGPAVLVSFLNIWVRKKIYFAKKMLKGSNIFISEDLPKEEGHIFYLCRQLKRQRKIKETWTKELVVYIKDVHDNVCAIKTKDELSAYSDNNTSGPLPQRPAPQRKAPQAVSGSVQVDSVSSVQTTQDDSSSDGEFQEAESDNSI